MAVVPETEPAFAAAPCSTGQAAAAVVPETEPVFAAAPRSVGHAAAAGDAPATGAAAMQSPATGAPVSGTVGPEAVAWEPGAVLGGVGVEAACGVIEQAGGLHGWVALGGYPPRAPTDPDMQNSRIRLLGVGIRYGRGTT